MRYWLAGAVRKGKIDWSRDHDLVTTFADGAHGDVEAGDEAGQEDDVVRVDSPIVAIQQTLANKPRRSDRIASVAEDAVVDSLMQCLDHFRRREKIHVRYPERQHVFRIA